MLSLVKKLLFVAFLMSQANLVYAAPDCTEIKKELEVKSKSITAMLVSLESLLGTEKSFVLPVAVLFQVDLSDQNKILTRIKELGKNLAQDQILNSPEFLRFRKCATEDETNSYISDLASKLQKVNEKKIAFLNLDEAKRKSRIVNYDSIKSQSSESAFLEKEVLKGQNNLTIAQSRLTQSEVDAEDISGRNDEKVKSVNTDIEKYLVDLESDQIEFLESVKIRSEKLDLAREKLKAALDADSSNDAQSLSLQFQQVSKIWEDQVDELLDLFSNLKTESEDNFTENFDLSQSQKAATSESNASLKQAYTKAQARRNELIEIRSTLLNNLKIKQFNLLTDSGEARARLLHDCDQTKNCSRPHGLNSEYLSGIIREVKVLPLRYVAGGLSKILEIKGKLGSGFDGWVSIAKQILMFLLLFLIPFLIAKTLSWVSKQLDQLRKSILSRSMMDFNRRTSFAMWISRLNPFLPPVGMAVGFYLAQKIIQTTDFKEFATFLYYFQVFYIYRIFRLILKIFLELLFATEAIESLRNQKLLLESSSTAISRVIFLEYALLHLVRDTVREALIYNLMTRFVFWFNLVFIFTETYRWRTQILKSFMFRFPKINEKISLQTFSKTYIFLFAPFLVIGLVGYEVFVWGSSYLIRLDLIKKLLSEIFKYQLQNKVEIKETVAPSAEYLSCFDYYMPARKDIYVELKNPIENLISAGITNWLSSKVSEDLSIVVGNRGMGKTTVLNKIIENLGSERFSLSTVPPRVINEKDFFNWISELLMAPILTIEDFTKFDQGLTVKQVLVVDDIQNLFLGVVNGFDSYKKFIEIISLKTRNIFWCLSVNSRSWAYLKGVFGAEHFYGKTYTLAPWRDFEIQALILKRHESTQYAREFDKSIKAYGAGGDSLGQQAETQFFRLLWGQSRGNPRSALMYWVSAISAPEPKKVFVGVPYFMSSSLVSSMSDESLFILAAIARHDSLSQEELNQTTCIEDSTIRKCLKESHDKNLIWTDEKHRVRISSRAQHVIDYFLIGKNFLYE